MTKYTFEEAEALNAFMRETAETLTALTGEPWRAQAPYDSDLDRFFLRRAPYGETDPAVFVHRQQYGAKRGALSVTSFYPYEWARAVTTYPFEIGLGAASTAQHLAKSIKRRMLDDYLARHVEVGQAFHQRRNREAGTLRTMERLAQQHGLNLGAHQPDRGRIDAGFGIGTEGYGEAWGDVAASTHSDRVDIKIHGASIAQTEAVLAALRATATTSSKGA